MARVYFTEIDPSYLWDKFDYKPLTGELIRRHTSSFGHRAGTVVGCKNRQGYITTNLWGKGITVHRLVYAWVKGYEPIEGFHIHHVDGNPSNNAWNNLVAVTVQEHAALHRKTRRACKG